MLALRRVSLIILLMNSMIHVHRLTSLTLAAKKNGNNNSNNNNDDGIPINHLPPNAVSSAAGASGMVIVRRVSAAYASTSTSPPISTSTSPQPQRRQQQQSTATVGQANAKIVITVLGDSFSGKSCLLHAFTTGAPISEVPLTLQPEGFFKHVAIGQDVIKLHLWWAFE